MNKLFYLLLVFTAGCASLPMESATYYPDGKYPATNPSNIQIYKNNPPRSHTVLGEINPRSSLGQSQLEEMKVLAAGMGADGVYCMEEKICDAPETISTRTTIDKRREQSVLGNREVTTIDSRPMQFCQTKISCQAIKFN